MLSPGSESGAAAGRSMRIDAMLTMLLFAAGSIGYGALALRLAEGGYYEYFNLAFDFDASRVLSLLTASPPDAFGFKHPLMLMFRPLGLAVMTLGVPAKQAAGVVMAAFGAGTLCLVFLFFRAARIDRSVALALCALFAVSATQILTAIITETYGFAGFSIALVWLVARYRIETPGRFGMLRYAAAILAAGVTITNAVQPVMAEVMVCARRPDIRSAIRGFVTFGLVCALLFGVCAALLWSQELWVALRDPRKAARTIWWLQTKGPTTGLLQVTRTFVGFSFVAPDYTTVTLPETTRMIDFRAWSFPSPGDIVVVLWLIFATLGLFAGLAHRGYRALALAIGATLLFNIVFHGGFQFRGSVYLYAAHAHFLTFVLAAGAAPWLVGRPRARATYVAATLVLAVLFVVVNVPMAVDFAARFDRPDTQCPAPCSDGVP